MDGNPVAGSGPAEGYALAYEEAKRALEEQERVVTELRSRAGVLIGAAAITTSFFGGRALTGDKVHTASWIAITCFALLGGTVLVVLWPWRDWRFTVNAQAFIETYLEPPACAHAGGAAGPFRVSRGARSGGAGLVEEAGDPVDTVAVEGQHDQAGGTYDRLTGARGGP